MWGVSSSGREMSNATSPIVSAVARDPRVLIVRGKGGKERMVPLTDAAMLAIKAYKAARGAFLGPGQTSAFLFPSRAAL